MTNGSGRVARTVSLRVPIGLEILSFAAGRDVVRVADVRADLELAHTTAHEYCRDLEAAGLFKRTSGKPAEYASVPFTIDLSLASVAEAVESESDILDYAIDTDGDDCIDAVLDVWDRVEAGDLISREASEEGGMAHADFLRVVDELDLSSR